jgi:hypothetical protein
MDGREKTLRMGIIGRIMEAAKGYYLDQLEDGAYDDMTSDEMVNEIVLDAATALAEEPHNTQDIAAFLRRCDELDELIAGS